MDSPADTGDNLIFLPLGGAHEIGMNLNLYGFDGQWLMIDCGIAFGDESTPGVEVLVPDIQFVEDRRDALLGLVLTHGHEDHLGAVQYLWPRFRCPVYATPFTANLLRAKLTETDFGEEVPIIEIPLSGSLTLGAFEIRFVGMTHSIPEPNSLVLGTPLGTVVHSGDWKLDPDPQIGPCADEQTLRRVGEEGVLALVCDSTNALEPGHSGSEADVAATLAELVADQPNRVAVTCFASNVARLRSIALAAEKAGRSCALVGRSLWRIHDAARAAGYLDGLARFLNDEEAGYLPRQDIVLICTGSQGESRSALSRIAGDRHPHLLLEQGDTVIFSSREIPGNEKAIARLENALERLGVHVITVHEAPVHVSGHPARDELVTLYQWLRPQTAVPVHGDRRRQHAHARLAGRCQVQSVLVPENGDVIRLAPGRPEIVGQVPVGRLAVEGGRLIPEHGSAIRARRKLVHNGAAVATVVLDGTGRLVVDPQITLLGLEDAGDEAQLAALVDAARYAVLDLSQSRRRNDASVREVVGQAVRRAARKWTGKRPVTEVQIVRA